MKESNANGDGKSLVLNEWGFQILLFTVQKSSANSQNFFLVGRDESSVYFSNRDGISGYFSHRGAPGTNFRLFFQWGGVPTGSVTQGCIHIIFG